MAEEKPRNSVFKRPVGGVAVLPLLDDDTSLIRQNNQNAAVASAVVGATASWDPEDAFSTPPGSPAPPAYTEHTAHQRLEASGTSTGASGNTIERQMPPRMYKLRHIDFMPVVKKPKSEDYENFKQVLSKANQWLEESPNVEIFNCETVSWLVGDKTPLFTDNSIVFKSMSDQRKNKYRRGLRIWYFSHGDQFWMEASQGRYQLNYRDYVPDKLDTFCKLVKKVNIDIAKSPIQGKILKYETLTMLQDAKGPDTCAWKEAPENPRKFVFFLRLYFLEGAIPEQSGEISTQDFIPKYNQRTQLNQGFETLSEVFLRCSKWIYQQNELKFTNVQTLYVKVKKDEKHDDIGQKCRFKEHGSAYGTISDQKTEYYRIVRVYFTKPFKGNDASTLTVTKLTYHTFSPAPVGEVKTLTDLTESSFEDLRMTMEKVQLWLAMSGAKIFGVETVPIRLVSGGQQGIGGEGTVVYNGKERNLVKEPWMYQIRLFLGGDYQDVPYFGHLPADSRN